MQFSARSARGQAGPGGPGDFFDVFALPSGRWGVVVGTARAEPAGAEVRSGGGVALARTVLRATAQVEFRPAVVMASVNRALLAAPERERLRVAVTYATLRPGLTGTWVRMCTAGGLMAHVRRRGGAVAALGGPGAPLGAGAEPRPHLSRLLLRPGDSLILVTKSVPMALGTAVRGLGDDGVLPAGVGRLRAIIGELAEASAARSTDTILRAVREAVGGRPGHEIVVVTVKMPRRRGSGMHSAGWPGTRRYTNAARNARTVQAADAADGGDLSGWSAGSPDW